MPNAKWGSGHKTPIFYFPFLFFPMFPFLLLLVFLTIVTGNDPVRENKHGQGWYGDGWFDLRRSAETFTTDNFGRFFPRAGSVYLVPR